MRVFSHWTTLTSTTGGEVLIRQSGPREVLLLVPCQSELTEAALAELLLDGPGLLAESMTRTDNPPGHSPDEYLLTVALALPD